MWRERGEASVSVDSLGKSESMVGECVGSRAWNEYSRAMSLSCPRTEPPSPCGMALHLALMCLHLHHQDCQNIAFWDTFLLRVVTCTAPYVSFLLSVFTTHLMPYLSILFISPSLLVFRELEFLALGSLL